MPRRLGKFKLSEHSAASLDRPLFSLQMLCRALEAKWNYMGSSSRIIAQGIRTNCTLAVTSIMRGKSFKQEKTMSLISFKMNYL